MNFKKMTEPLLALLVTAIVLFGTATILRPVGEKMKEQDKMQIMSLLLPGNAAFTEEAYEGEDTNITAVFKGENGYVIETTVSGYVDNIELMVGVNKEGSITGVVIYDMAETRGLGRRAMTDMTFLSQFLGTKGDAEIGSNVDAISGATVTSKAVVKVVNSAAAFVTGADISSGATEWGN